MESLDQKKVDVNQASREELENIPGFGPALAARLIAGRPYSQLADLERVSGIGANLLTRLLPYLSLDPLPVMENSDLGNKARPVRKEVKADPAEVKPKKLDVQTGVDSEPFEQVVEQPISPVTPAFTVVTAEEVPLLSRDIDSDAPQLETLDSVPHAVEHKEPESAGGVRPVIDFISDMAGRVEQVVRRPSTPQPVSEQETSRPQVEHRLAVIPQWPRFDDKPGFDKNDALFWGAGIGVLVFILSVLVSLGILLGVNGSLSFIPARDMISIQSKIDAINTSLDTVQEETGSLRERLDAFESLSGRLKDMEQETKSLRSEMEKNNQEMIALQDQAKQLNDQVTQLQERRLIFDKFLDKLRALLNELTATP
jgi:hypothetical protein